MSDVIGALASLTVFAAITFGVLAAVPRTKRAMIKASVVLLIIFSVMSAIGSALVGPLDMRPMILLAPLILASAGGWYLLKIKPHEMRNG